MNEIEKYLNEFASPNQKPIINKWRKLTKEVVPEAEELISYGVPTFKLNKRPLIYFAAFKDHLSIYPTSDEMVKSIPAISKYRTGKGTLRFKADDLPSDDLIKKIIRFRLNNLTGYGR